ncbi:MAG: hypothetical protein Q8L24_01630 [bacterium]|nr:hypothetical protein [bacterium]
MDKLQIQDGLQVADIERMKSSFDNAEKFVNKSAIAMIIIGLLLAAAAIWMVF